MAVAGAALHGILGSLGTGWREGRRLLTERYGRGRAQEVDDQQQELVMQIPPGPHLGDIVVRAEHVRKGFGDNLLMEDLTFEQWSAVLGVNLTGAFLCAQEAIKLMKAQNPQGGRIINNGSISAHTPRPNSAPYTTTKHAITGLTKCIALDGRKYDIACSQIDIGNAATEMTERMTAGVPQASGVKMVEPRMNVQHVAEAVVYMASLPLDANVLFTTVMSTKMPFVGRG